MQQLSRTGYLSLREAAEWLKIGADRNAVVKLRGELRRAEARAGLPIMKRGTRGRLEVTKSQLREHLPEHFSRREVTFGGFAKRLAAYVAVVAKVKKEQFVLAKQLRNVTHRVAALEQQAGASNGIPKRRS